MMAYRRFNREHGAREMKAEMLAPACGARMVKALLIAAEHREM